MRSMENRHRRVIGPNFGGTAAGKASSARKALRQLAEANVKRAFAAETSES
jgi:hypothetical protein